MFAIVFLLLALLSVVSAFKSNRFGASIAKSNTRVYEDFRLERTNGVFADGVYSEKQLREFTATYSNDERVSFLSAIAGVLGGLLPKISATSKLEGSAQTSSIASSLKGTISPAVLEEKTKQYVNGKLDAAKFYSTLKTCFGEKVDNVLPEIISSLPASKQSGLKKYLKK